MKRFPWVCFSLCSLAGLLVSGCNGETSQPTNTKTDQTTPEDQEVGHQMGIQSEPFGSTEEGQDITQYHLMNKNGVQVSIITYGAIVTSVRTPDKNGKFENITLGFDNLEGYLAGHPYYGAIVGRYGNRIAKGKFTLNDKEYTLATNNDPNHLHGGVQGFDKKVWRAEEVKQDDSVGLRMTYVSPDGEEGYPGELRVTVTYTLTNTDELRIDYEAMSDADTVLNLTNHCYWNLESPKKDILDHVLMLNCKRYLPVDETAIPTGELKSVEGTPFDFTKPMAIGSRFEDVKGSDPTGGYDHCYVIDPGEKPMQLAARVTEPDTGRVMEISTDQPGIQFYTGNFMNDKEAGGHGQHHAFCLETQHFPDSPNQPEFPSTVLKKGEVFRSTTIHKFSVEKAKE